MENKNEENYEGIKVITRKDGTKYSIRVDRHRYFFPHEWNKFINSFKKGSKHYMFFLTLLHTGARAMEALHLRVCNFDFQRGTITFDIVKERVAKKRFSSLAKKRIFFVSENYLREVAKYIKQNNLKENDFLFLDNSKLPPNYLSLTNSEKKKFYKKREINYCFLLKRRLKKIGIKDWYNFSLHNIRKTYANWMRIYDIRTEELCYRLGHDLETFQTNYGSTIIFSPEEKVEIMRIFGKIK